MRPFRYATTDVRPFQLGPFWSGLVSTEAVPEWGRFGRGPFGVGPF